MRLKSAGIVLPVVLGMVGMFLLVYAYIVQETRAAALIAAHIHDYRQAKYQQQNCDTRVSILYQDEMHVYQQVDMMCEAHRTRVHLRKVLDSHQQDAVSWIEILD